MSRVGRIGRWKKTTKGWRYVYNDDNDRKRPHQCLKPSPQIILSTTTLTESSKHPVWQFVIAYISSPTDLINLGRTCRSLYKLVESELGWSYLIRTKFGYRLWFHHVRRMFYQKNNQQINLHTDIEMMENNKLANECATIPRTFLLNTVKEQFMIIARAILRCYRYHSHMKTYEDTIFIAPVESSFRQLTSFFNIHSEHLSNVQRRTVPLTKLIYFYLADRRQLPAVSFEIIYPYGCVREFKDPKASIGRALSLYRYDKMFVIHPFHSIMPGRYEIFWRLRFTSPPTMNSNLELLAIPSYGLMVSKSTSSKEFGKHFEKYGYVYFHQSIGTITVFKRCIVFVGCIDLTQGSSRTCFVLDYVEMIAVV